MSSRGVHVVLAGLVAVLLLGFTVPAYADTSTPPPCNSEGVDPSGLSSLCTDTDGSIVDNSPMDDPSGGGFGDDGGIPGWFVAAFVLVLLLGIGATIWRVSTARQIASAAGMDPDAATKIALLTDNGLDATYLAANLKQPPAPKAEPPADDRAPAADRLTELKGLLDGGLITQAEYDERRKGIIDGV